MRKLGISVSLSLVFILLVLVVLYVISLRSLHQSFDAGAVIAKDSLTYTFRIPNYTWRTMEVGNATASCGCTVVEELPASVPPFSALRIPVNIALAGRQGEFTSRVAVDLKGHGAAELSVFADIYPALPDPIDLGPVEKGALVERAFLAPPAFTRDALAGLNGAVEAGLTTLDGQPILKLAIRAPMESGDFSFPLADGAGSLVVKGRVARDVEATVSVLSMGYLRHGQGEGSSSTRKAKFVSPHKLPFKWRPDLAKHSEHIALKEVASESGAEIEVLLRHPKAEGVYRETVSFYFDVEGEKEAVEVPLEIYAYLMENVQ